MLAVYEVFLHFGHIISSAILTSTIYVCYIDTGLCSLNIISPPLPPVLSIISSNMASPYLSREFIMDFSSAESRLFPFALSICSSSILSGASVSVEFTRSRIYSFSSLFFRREKYFEVLSPLRNPILSMYRKLNSHQDTKAQRTYPTFFLPLQRGGQGRGYLCVLDSLCHVLIYIG